ncbi:hypothetical protein THRCLA_03278 [Thraustotheca clavata]|uniref:Uncharacterized protein n=1 Tax=Thraustotheca clavata TaxID=74557 RepID=A0A1W0A2N4_9STRA|nr:hypothetical protein THRCLA_03278 [Thraustotheca clavata]
MGRSQLQYRRGRGGRGRGEQRSSIATRALESNAFRYTQEEENDENELVEEDVFVKRDLRFNPNVQNLSSSTGGIGYFQSKTEQEWEQEMNKQEVVALDFKAIGHQISSLPPSSRFNIEEKYCIDFPIQEEIRDVPIVKEDVKEKIVDMKQEKVKNIIIKEEENKSIDDELDELLNM